jgi:branched-chain amino acid transport system ATP-binding protein
MTRPRALEASALTRRYGGFTALDDVSIAVDAGKVHGLIGANGAGKTTLMDCLTGRSRQSQGRVLVDGRDVSGLSIAERRHAGLSRSFQKTNIFPELEIREQIDLAAIAVGADDVEEVMDVFDLARIAERAASQVSYGDQRRLDLALALVGRPKVLLLDEPAAGLTVAESKVLVDLLRRLVSVWDVGVILVEHDMDVIFGVCDELTVLNLGRVLVRGAPEEVRNMPQVKAAYLGEAA